MTDVETTTSIPTSITMQKTLTTDALQTAIDLSSSQFLKGFLVGQFVLLLFGLFLLKLLFLRGPLDLRFSRKSKTKPNFIIPSKHQKPLEQLLSEMHWQEGQIESCRWLNILMGQIWLNIRSRVEVYEEIYKSLDLALNEKFLKQHDRQIIWPSHIAFQQLSLGYGSPLIHEARVGYSETGRLSNELFLEWSNVFSITFETEILLNWPMESFAGLPTQLQLSLKHLKGTLSIEMDDDQLDIFFMHAPQMELEIKSLLGDKTKVKDLPKLEQLLCSFIQNHLEEEFVWPNYKSIRFLPFDKNNQ